MSILTNYFRWWTIFWSSFINVFFRSWKINMVIVIISKLCCFKVTFVFFYVSLLQLMCVGLLKLFIIIKSILLHTMFFFVFFFGRLWRMDCFHSRKPTQNTIIQIENVILKWWKIVIKRYLSNFLQVKNIIVWSSH